ncbi:uncharacterized protein LOC143880888 [Tasmannia lanceolata]|uniref:uncharacterized protein LOC143880888 n=1 Tax=Tasmannia lanceolata TaxID=3420 RepID=UPI00406419E5
MAGIPVRFKRVTAPFDQMARARLCESSGSDHSAGNSPELGDLVDLFMEEGEEDYEEKKEIEGRRAELEDEFVDSDTKGMLESLLGVVPDDDFFRRRISDETEMACLSIGTERGEGFKRRLMIQLRERGLDAGLCKSRWVKSGRFPAGDYEYIDVIVKGGARYIVEIGLAGEFEIARPTSHYLSLLNFFPAVFVGKSDALKQVVRLMCSGAKESMKSRGMHLPPWRRNGYMQGKWFGSYKRTTNLVPSNRVSDSGGIVAGKRSIGFARVPATARFCRGELLRKEGLKAGNLTAVFNGMHG